VVIGEAVAEATRQFLPVAASVRHEDAGSVLPERHRGTSLTHVVTLKEGSLTSATAPSRVRKPRRDSMPSECANTQNFKTADSMTLEAAIRGKGRSSSERIRYLLQRSVFGVSSTDELPRRLPC
jgi:hypothetical protein